MVISKLHLLLYRQVELQFKHKLLVCNNKLNHSNSNKLLTKLVVEEVSLVEEQNNLLVLEINKVQCFQMHHSQQVNRCLVVVVVRHNHKVKVCLVVEVQE